MADLKSCPFCGGEAILYSDYSSELDETRWSLFHECDGHKGESAGYGSGYHPWFETPWYKTEAEAVEAWNTRHVETCMLEGSYSMDGWLDERSPIWTFDFSCGHSFTSLDNEPPAHCPECGAKVVTA